MLKKCLAAGVLVYALVASAPMPAGVDAQIVPDTLTLLPMDTTYVMPRMNADRAGFINFIFWRSAPDARSALVHAPDTIGWNASTSSLPQDTLSVPFVSGAYTGAIDRTVRFFAKNTGLVGGVKDVIVRYTIVGEENFANQVNLVDSLYSPGDTIPLVFRNSLPPFDSLSLGANVHFSSGLIDSNGEFIVGLEDFEGFHVWRDTSATGIDISVIGEMSKEEAFDGADFDSIYFNEVIPALRATGRFVFQFPVPGFGDEIDIRNIHPNGKLGPDEFAWFDLNAFNGFTYYYLVTSFDRGYTVRTSTQGLNKFDDCPLIQGQPIPCPANLASVSTKLVAQNDLRQIYAVPNPYRSGSSAFSTPNYHNFPDNKMRFVNVPADCKLRIYTPAGDLVWEFDNVGGTGNIPWDTTNLAGREVSSGIYLYRVETPGGEGVFGRIIIIR